MLCIQYLKYSILLSQGRLFHVQNMIHFIVPPLPNTEYFESRSLHLLLLIQRIEKISCIKDVMNTKNLLAYQKMKYNTSVTLIDIMNNYYSSVFYHKPSLITALLYGCVNN